MISRATPQGDILGFAPPLCLTRKEADTIVAVTREAIDEVTATCDRAWRTAAAYAAPARTSGFCRSASAPPARRMMPAAASPVPTPSVASAM